MALVFSTCAKSEEAGRVARHLLERRLAACVNILPEMRSLYWWQGNLEEASECLLVIKTRKDLLPELQAELASVHSYEVPEILALPVLDGSAAYLDWMQGELRLRSTPES